MIGVTFLFLISTIVILVGIPIVVVTAEITASLIPRRISASSYLTPSCVVIVIPAHDEATVIGATLDTIRRTLTDRDRILVVADNCTDATAEVARGRGTEVIERQDPSRRGKGYALQFGVDHLASGHPPAVVVFIDADCVVGPRTTRQLAEAAYTLGQPVQSQYLLESGPNAPRSQRISAFAVRVKNDLRPLGCSVLGIPCLITGSGFAMPWEIAKCAKLGTGNLVEDMALGIDLVAMGFRPLYLREANVQSLLPDNISARNTQRTRWEHGHLTVIPYAFSVLLPAAFQQRAWAPLGYALMVAVPPLSLLLFGSCGVMMATIVLAIATGFTAPAIAMISLISILAIGILNAWWKAGRDLLRFSDFIVAPYSVGRKIPTYVALFFGRKIGWVRTRRPDE